LTQPEVRTICILSCCSWMWVQLATFPLSDLLFFALSSAVLLLLSLAKQRPAFQIGLCFVPATLLAGAAFLVRTIGAALFIAIAVALIETQTARRFLGRRTAIAALVVAAAVAAGIGVTRPQLFTSPWYAGALSYLTELKHPWRTTEEITWWRVGEVGELAQNISSTALAPTTPTLPIDSTSPWVYITEQFRALRMAVGLVFSILILAGLWTRRRQLAPVEGYFFAFVGILLIWPFDDPRFFAPVLPLLFAYAWLGLRALQPPPVALRRFLAAYCFVFCCLGAVAMGDSLRVTYFDRLHPWHECRVYMADIPTWLAAYDRYGGLRPIPVNSRGKAERVVP
jgi:hypothetical protein